MSSFSVLLEKYHGQPNRVADSTPKPASRMSELSELLTLRRLHAVFQPIVDLRNGSIYGFEGLIRGPENSPLHTPHALFEQARRSDMTVELERLCRETVLNDYAELDLPGRLFINSSYPCLEDALLRQSEEMRHLQSLDMTPDRIVIELTENHLVEDFSILHEVLVKFRRAGFDIAMDDLGEGFSNLRMWSEVRPEIVKIDRHFIGGIAENPLKFQLVRAIHDIAETCGAKVVAEGIETEAEFIAVRDLGIHYGQGFLIARPAATPSVQLGEQVARLLENARLKVQPRYKKNQNGYIPVQHLVRHLEPVTPDTESDEVYTRFETTPELRMLPVVDEGKPIGAITRFSLIDRFARPYRRELYGKKPCHLLMNDSPLIVDQATSVQDLARMIGNSEQISFSDDFIITQEGVYLGIGSNRELIKLITEMQISSARYANPLTQLPGNVPICEHIERLLEIQIPFVACYADLDSFKPYNDVYGYQRGDEVILMLGKVLDEVIDHRADFLGHIGGDDFMILFQGDRWEDRCRRALELFDSRIAHLVEAEHLVMGGFQAEDRRGKQIFHSIPSLSLGCIPATPGQFKTHHEVAAAVADAKHQAKKTRGSSLFIERRQKNA
ncbi:MAG TPA: GGDEF domain-containing protein [Rhodocyclaceae bacterium]|nr:GGDEF domain-containing protein [Rhodocyclaceae bacterium]